MNDVFKRIGEIRIVPVISMDDAADALPLADALVGAGLPIAEITFRTAAAEQSIRTLAKRADLLVGAGTVLNVDTAKKAVDAGAKFIVAPGFNPKVVAWCVAHRVPALPGVATPTDIEMALDHGLDVVKFFPAEALGGVKTLKIFAGPYPMMRYMPSSGIGMENIEPYLQFSKVLAVGGSWMVGRDMIAAKQFNKIGELSRQVMDVVRRVTPAGK